MVFGKNKIGFQTAYEKEGVFVLQNMMGAPSLRNSQWTWSSMFFSASVVESALIKTPFYPVDLDDSPCRFAVSVRTSQGVRCRVERVDHSGLLSQENPGSIRIVHRMQTRQVGWWPNFPTLALKTYVSRQHT